MGIQHPNMRLRGVLSVAPTRPAAGLAFFVCVAGSACDRTPEVPPASSPSPPSAAQAGAASPAPPAHLTSFGYDLVRVAAGTYSIGSPPDEPGRRADEIQHSVTLSQGLLIGTTELTQAQYQSVQKDNPAARPDCYRAGNAADPAGDQPAYCVSWLDAVGFANAASIAEGLPECYRIDGVTVLWPDSACIGFRLPTEAEWEVAARAGSHAPFSGADTIEPVGWFAGNSGGASHPVGQLAPNPLGLYDMSGNVWEWTWDIYDDDPYGSDTDPQGALDGPVRSVRGGSYLYASAYARTAARGRSSPQVRSDTIGVRLVRTLP